MSVCLGQNVDLNLRAGVFCWFLVACPSCLLHVARILLSISFRVCLCRVVLIVMSVQNLQFSVREGRIHLPSSFVSLGEGHTAELGRSEPSLPLSPPLGPPTSPAFPLTSCLPSLPCRLHPPCWTPLPSALLIHIGTGPQTCLSCLSPSCSQWGRGRWLLA